MPLHLLLSAALAVALSSAQASPLDAARAALARGDADAAVALFEKAVAQAPNSAEAHSGLGDGYAAQAAKSGMFSAAGFAAKARAEWERAVQIKPDYQEARFSLVEFYAVAPAMMGGSFDKSFEQAEAIKKLDAVAGHRAYASIYMHQTKPELARKEYVDAVAEQPKSAKAHSFFGGFLATSEKNYPAALAEFETALKLDAAYMPPWYYIGRTAAQAGSNPARGEEALKKYLTYAPKASEPAPANAHYWLGMIYEKQGRRTDARQQYETALQLNPSLKTAAEGLKRVQP